MDDITFRRTIYADPFTTDPEVIKAAKNDPKKQAFWDEIRAMEASLEEAMNIPVPEDLADKLILRQSLNRFQKEKKRQPWYLALAASIVLASIVSIKIFSSASGDLSTDIFAHMKHLDYEVKKYGDVDMASLNSKLASYNGKIEEGMGDIVSANYCYLHSIKSLHLIIRGEQGLTSLFVIPSKLAGSIEEEFNNDTYTGTSFLSASAKVIVVGENASQVALLKEKAKQLLSFSV
jgi:hypothetical protein